jgi:hypothetical protein
MERSMDMKKITILGLLGGVLFVASFLVVPLALRMALPPAISGPDTNQHEQTIRSAVMIVSAAGVEVALVVSIAALAYRHRDSPTALAPASALTLAASQPMSRRGDLIGQDVTLNVRQGAPPNASEAE